MLAAPMSPSVVRLVAACLLGAAALAAQDVGEPAFRVPVRSITRLHGSLTNTLTGVGLVTGLNKTGASDRATRQILASFLEDHRIRVPESTLNSGAVALVSVTAELPSFAHVGMSIDVQVQALTAVDSLEGGVLQMTELRYFDGPNSRTYATAAGTITTGGFGFSASTTRVTRNNPAAGRISRGGSVVEAVSAELLSEIGAVELILTQPSLRTAGNIVQSANLALLGLGASAEIHDEGLVRILLPREQQNRAGALRALQLVGDLRVEVENPVKVVIEIDTGTLVVGSEVRISPCVVMTSDVTVSIVDEREVVQPLPFSPRGRTTQVDRSRTEVTVEDRGPAVFDEQTGTATVAELAESLRALGLPTRQVIEVFQQLDRGGFLHAPLEIR
ncbi:MAG: flagellar basal body P-ring protein FlgI [Planctomycetes bacterium]|nr:flagellar basal body P-ring protein FlgI [Planctomycetota bacterium]